MSPEASALSSWLSLERGRRLLCSIAGTKHSLDPLTFSCHLLITLSFFLRIHSRIRFVYCFSFVEVPDAGLGQACVRAMSALGLQLWGSLAFSSLHAGREHRFFFLLPLPPRSACSWCAARVNAPPTPFFFPLE